MMQVIERPVNIVLIDAKRDRNLLLAELDITEKESIPYIWKEYKREPRSCITWTPGIPEASEVPEIPENLISLGSLIFQLGKWGSQVRWLQADELGTKPVRLREVIEKLGCYEPPRLMTRLQLREATYVQGVGESYLRKEMYYFERSPYVLNARIQRVLVELSERVTWTEMAQLCNATKKHRNTKFGDASWIQRRIGLKPERMFRTGNLVKSKWISKALIKRIADGLGLDEDDLRLD
jgi:hypothetical protein